MQRRLAQIDESIARYLSQLDSADRQGEAIPEAKITRLNEKIAALREEIQRLNGLNTLMMRSEDKQISLTDPMIAQFERKPKMILKSIILTLAFACTGVFISFETASAGQAHDRMTGRVRDSVGCQLQGKVVRQMQKHPERWGKPPASVAAQWRKPSASVVASLKK